MSIGAVAEGEDRDLKILLQKIIFFESGMLCVGSIFSPSKTALWQQ